MVAALSSTRVGDGSSAFGTRRGRSTATEPVCVRQFRRWLGSGFTGCGFAQSFANNSRLLLGAVELGVNPDQVDAMFDYAARDHGPAVVIFPFIRPEEAIVEQLRRLETGNRWTLSRERVAGLDTDDVLIGLPWRTDQGLISQPMGFGPFPTMPVTRRAPYICLATWPGE